MRISIYSAVPGGDGSKLTGLLADIFSDMSDRGQSGIRVTRAGGKLEPEKETCSLDQKVNRRSGTATAAYRGRRMLQEGLRQAS